MSDNTSQNDLHSAIRNQDHEAVRGLIQEAGGDLRENIMRVFMELSLAERGFIMLRGAESGELQPAILREFPEDDIYAQLVTAKAVRDIIKEVAERGLPLLTDNALPNYYWLSKENAAAAMKQQLRVVIAVPLKVDDAVIGVVYLDKRISVGVFNQETDFLLVQSFAEAIAPLLIEI